MKIPSSPELSTLTHVAIALSHVQPHINIEAAVYALRLEFPEYLWTIRQVGQNRLVEVDKP